MVQYHSPEWAHRSVRPCRSIAQYGKERKKSERRSGKLINLYLYSDGCCSMSRYKTGKRDNTQIADIVLNIFPTCSIKLFPNFLMSVMSVSIFFCPGQFPLTSRLIHSSWLHVKALRGVIDMWMASAVFFYLLYVNPFSCCIQRQASCSNLLTVLVKLLSKLLSLIETCSLWLRKSSNHSCCVVILPPTGPFGDIPFCCGNATRCRYWKALPPNDQFYYGKCHVTSDNCEIWH